jgi:hypothetical protein
MIIILIPLGRERYLVDQAMSIIVRRLLRFTAIHIAQHDEFHRGVFSISGAFDLACLLVSEHAVFIYLEKRHRGKVSGCQNVLPQGFGNG